VGVGPLAGPVVAAAVILDPGMPIDGLGDSKSMNAMKRDILDKQIKEKSLAWAIARAEVNEIDQLNIHHAGLLAMKRAIELIKLVPELVLVDGRHCPEVNIPAEAIIKGDTLVPAISAASIIAKVARDAEMTLMESVYPGYGFGKHKGYATKEHLMSIKRLGVCEIHRRSFAPIKDCI